MTTPEDRWPRSRIRKAVALAIIGIAAVALVIRLSTVFIPVGLALLLTHR